MKVFAAWRFTNHVLLLGNAVRASAMGTFVARGQATPVRMTESAAIQISAFAAMGYANAVSGARIAPGRPNAAGTICA